MAAIAWDRIEERGERRSLALVTAPPSRRRPSAAVYRRRRLVALLVALVLVVVALQALVGMARASATAGSAAPSGPVSVVAEEGDSYWTIASRLHDGGDIRSTVDALVRANGGAELRAGDRIVLPG